jgi:hypothetical protein
MILALVGEVSTVEGLSMAANYGIDKGAVPLPGARRLKVRGGAEIISRSAGTD